MRKLAKGPPGGPVGDAEEFARILGEVASWPEAWGVLSSSGSNAAGWEAYRRSRAGGGQPPESILRWLDGIAAAVLDANGDPAAIMAALGCAKPERGGPGAVAQLPKQLETQALCTEVWMAATGGVYRPGDAPPRKGTSAALRKVADAHGIEFENLRRRWHRWAARTGCAPMTGAELQRLLTIR